MRDPSKYTVLLRHIFRLLDDAELALENRRWQMAYAMSIYVMEEAGKYTQLVGDYPPPRGNAHVERQKLVGEHLTKTAIFEAFARDVDGFLARLRDTNDESYREALDMPRHDLIMLCLRTATEDPDFNMDRYVRMMIGDDLSQTFVSEAATRGFHEVRQQCFHADYDSAGNLIADPFDVGEAEAREVFEFAWLAAKYQTLWQSSWDKQNQR